MTTTLTNRALNAAVNAIAALAADGKALYTTADGTVLASVPLLSPAFAPAANGAALALGVPQDVTITTSGTVAICRIVDSSGAALADMTVTSDATFTSGAFLPNPVLTAGEIARLGELSLTMPATDANEAA